MASVCIFCATFEATHQGLQLLLCRQGSASHFCLGCWAFDNFALCGHVKAHDLSRAFGRRRWLTCRTFHALFDARQLLVQQIQNAVCLSYVTVDAFFVFQPTCGFHLGVKDRQHLLCAAQKIVSVGRQVRARKHAGQALGNVFVVGRTLWFALLVEQTEATTGALLKLTLGSRRLLQRGIDEVRAGQFSLQFLGSAAHDGRTLHAGFFFSGDVCQTVGQLFGCLSLLDAFQRGSFRCYLFQTACFDRSLGFLVLALLIEHQLFFTQHLGRQECSWVSQRKLTAGFRTA